MEKFGYVRVSMRDQNEDRQLIALRPCGIPARNLFVEKQSGKDFDRPAYKRMLKRMKKGDLLIVKSIDRLGRNYAEIIEQWRHITKSRGADIRVLDMPLLDTTYCKDLLGTFIGDLTLQVLSFAAQLERESMLQRQAEGIAAAREKCVVFGRAPRALPSEFEEVFGRWRDGELTAQQAAELCGMSRSSLYRRTAVHRTPARRGR